MDVTVKYVDRMTFLGRGTSNHWVPMDTTAVGGVGAGSSPMELLLMAIAGCSGMDVVSILAKKRIKFDLFEIRVEGKRAEEHPKRFTDIELNYIFRGESLPEKPITDAVRLSQEKYCSVVGTVNESTRLSFRVTLLPVDGEDHP